MPAPPIDALISPTLKYVREGWWNAEFTEFLVETLHPRPGNRILDVGCGEGLAEVSIGHLHISQVRQVGIDLIESKAVAARHEAAAHNLRASFAAGDAVRLPFAADVFDAVYCVAVLQHVPDLDAAIGEMARVTRRGGRIVAVEPDNSARYGYSSIPEGARAFAAAARFFTARAAARGDGPEPAVGPKLAALFARHGVEPMQVRLFPVAEVLLSPPPAERWQLRRHAVERTVAVTRDEMVGASVRAAGREYLDALDAYAAAAVAAPATFVEIQHTLLFATVGQRVD
jgi:ubiquinone/menaquinone biosynthesis C-methylase UbiE